MLLLLTGAGWFFGCSSPPPKRSANDPIVVGVTRLPDRIAPLSSPRFPEERLIASMLFSGLYSLAANVDSVVVSASIAADWPVPQSEDLTDFTVRLRTDARWSDGKPVSASDVQLTWRVLSAYQNDYPRRALLLAQVRSVLRGDCDGCVRIVTTQSMTPDDLAWLLTFPLVAAHAVHLRHQTDLSASRFPGSRSIDVWLDNVVGRPVGSGAFVLEGSLDARYPAAVFKRISSGSTFVFRALPTRAAQQAALDNDELDVLIEPDSGLTVPRTSSLRRFESGRSTRIALVLNPGIDRWSAPQDRHAFLQRVSALLATGSTTGCKGRAGSAAATFRVLSLESGPLFATSTMRLRAALACLGRQLVVSRSVGQGAEGGASGYQALLVSVGDENADVARLAKLLVDAGIAGYDSSTAAYLGWMQAPSRLARDSMRERFFGALSADDAMTIIASRSQAILVDAGLAGLRFGAEGEIQLPDRSN